MGGKRIIHNRGFQHRLAHLGRKGSNLLPILDLALEDQLRLMRAADDVEGEGSHILDGILILNLHKGKQQRADAFEHQTDPDRDDQKDDPGKLGEKDKQRKRQKAQKYNQAAHQNPLRFIISLNRFFNPIGQFHIVHTVQPLFWLRCLGVSGGISKLS